MPCRPIPPVIDGREGDQKADYPHCCQVNYYRSLRWSIGQGINSRFGVIEVLGDDRWSTGFYRVFGRDEAQTPPGTPLTPKLVVLRGTPGQLKLDEPVTAFGGNPNMAPMTLKFSGRRVPDQSGKEVDDLPSRYDLPIRIRKTTGSPPSLARVDGRRM